MKTILAISKHLELEHEQIDRAIAESGFPVTEIWSGRFIDTDGDNVSDDGDEGQDLPADPVLEYAAARGLTTKTFRAESDVYGVQAAFGRNVAMFRAGAERVIVIRKDGAVELDDFEDLLIRAQMRSVRTYEAVIP